MLAYFVGNIIDNSITDGLILLLSLITTKNIFLITKIGSTNTS